MVQPIHPDFPHHGRPDARPAPPSTDSWVIRPDAKTDRQTTLELAGLDCPQEIGVVRDALNGLSGVHDLRVNLVAGRVMIRHEDAVTPQDLARVIEQAGLKVRRTNETSSPGAELVRSSRLISVVLSGAFAGVGLLMSWMDVAAAVVRPTFLIAIVAGGWHVFPKAWSAARALRPDMNLLMIVVMLSRPSRISRTFTAFLLFAALLLAAPVAGAEEAALADADDGTVKTAMDAFRAEFKGDDDAKTGALEKLAEIKHPKIFDVLGVVLRGKDSESVRSVAARMLGSYHDKQVVPHLLEGFKAADKEPAVLAKIITALGEIGDASAAELLGKHARSKGPNLDQKSNGGVQACIDSLGRLKAKSGIEDLLKLGETLDAMRNLDTEKRGMRNELVNRCIASLKRITGENLKADDNTKTLLEYRRW